MEIFDTKVQYIKYHVLKEVAKNAWKDTLAENMMSIPKTLIPGKTPTMRCCVYKERAILADRVTLAMGGDRKNPNVIEVIETACDECPMGGCEVTNACRGCLSHPCMEACKFGAISFDQNYVAHIDKEKCRECGACAKVCPFSAIISRKRPCENACKIGAIHMNEEKTAAIDNEKCIACGACVYQCPFGAVSDKSFILDAIDLLKNSEKNTKYKVRAIIAPAFASQFTYAKAGQVISAMKKLGFFSVTEVALGADMVADAESRELVEKGSLISSCCPAFLQFVEKNYPDLLPLISKNLSPMATVAKWLKEQDKECKVIFIGPCIAKKVEVKKETVSPYVDVALTFEELQALFDSKDMDITMLPEAELDDASPFGRNFARTGGLAEAVAQGLKEHGNEDFKLNALSCDGIEQCKAALLLKSRKLTDANFIEGMACIGGCVGGAGCLTHGEKNKVKVNQFGEKATKRTLGQEPEANG